MNKLFLFRGEERGQDTAGLMGNKVKRALKISVKATCFYHHELIVLSELYQPVNLNFMTHSACKFEGL